VKGDQKRAMLLIKAKKRLHDRVNMHDKVLGEIESPV
jgi:hypothetical protein